jgi:hypothetical protein
MYTFNILIKTKMVSKSRKLKRRVTKRRQSKSRLSKSRVNKRRRSLTKKLRRKIIRGGGLQYSTYPYPLEQTGGLDPPIQSNGQSGGGIFADIGDAVNHSLNNMTQVYYDLTGTIPSTSSVSLPTYQPGLDSGKVTIGDWNPSDIAGMRQTAGTEVAGM